MTGAKPDERIREPFIWDNKDGSKNSSWIDSRNDENKVAVNVQLQDKESLLNLYKNIIAVRNNSEALKYGDFELVETKGSNVFAFKRTIKDETVYVYVNLAAEDMKENIDISKAKVLYSNKSKDKSLSFKGEVILKGNEIMVLSKK
jgi:glycosidase